MRHKNILKLLYLIPLIGINFCTAPSNSQSIPPKIVIITVQFDSLTIPIASTIPPIKYDKQKVFMLEFDDGAVSAITHLPKIQSCHYTDGCGNKISYTAAIAINGRAAWDNAEIGATKGRGLQYDEQKKLVDAGWDVMNHSFYHEINTSIPGNPWWGYGHDTARNIHELDSAILSRYHYKMNTMVVPTNYSGFMIAAAQQGYLGGSSQSQEDTFHVVDPWHEPRRLNLMKKFTFLANAREFASEGWPGKSNYPWNTINQLLNYNSEKSFIELGTHGLNGREDVDFDVWLDDFITRNHDSCIFCSYREFIEYRHLRDFVTKTENIKGNTLTITIDYSSVPNKNISWYDLSFLLNGTAAIKNVTCNDDRYKVSFNPNTRLVNIKYRKTVW